jgi:thiamine pyrophosphokinase
VRALIVADSPSSLEPDALRALAATADRIIAADGGATRCLDAGLRPDAVVGDMDSLDPRVAASLRSEGIDFLTAPAEKDVSDLDLAVGHARTLGVTELVVIGALGGRLDHELAALGTLARAADLAPEIATPGARALVLSASGRSRASVLGPALFSLMPLLGEARVDCSGARWMLTNARLEPISSLGLSNKVPDGSVAEIVVHEGVVLLYLP